MSNLKRCPFCSGKAKIEWEDWKDISPTSGIYRLSVNHKPECFFVQMNGLNAKSEMISSNKERLAEAWNTRKPLERIVERLEEEYGTVIYEDGIIVGYDKGFIHIDEAIAIVREEGE